MGEALFFIPRTVRIVIPDVPHHVTQRGNNHQAVFFADRDQDDITTLRRATQTGRPLAGDSTMSEFEKLAGRRLRALPPEGHEKTQQPDPQGRSAPHTPYLIGGN